MKIFSSTLFKLGMATVAASLMSGVIYADDTTYQDSPRKQECQKKPFCEMGKDGYTNYVFTMSPGDWSSHLEFPYFSKNKITITSTAPADSVVFDPLMVYIANLYVILVNAFPAPSDVSAMGKFFVPIKVRNNDQYTFTPSDMDSWEIGGRSADSITPHALTPYHQVYPTIPRAEQQDATKAYPYTIYSISAAPAWSDITLLADAACSDAQYKCTTPADGSIVIAHIDKKAPGTSILRSRSGNKIELCGQSAVDSITLHPDSTYADSAYVLQFDASKNQWKDTTLPLSLPSKCKDAL